jgi:hypothetical protein
MFSLLRRHVSFIFIVSTIKCVKITPTEGRKRGQTVPDLAGEINVPNLADHVQQFLFEQLHPNDTRDLSEVPANQRPSYTGKISVFNSASSTFYAPSDLSGLGGMKREHIRSCPVWRNEHSRNDCVFIITDSDTQGMRGMDVARVLAFFSFRRNGKYFPCAVIRWFNRIGDAPDPDTGMWTVQPSTTNHVPHVAVIHIDTIFRAVHLIPVYGPTPLSPLIKFHHVLDVFTLFYVNKYADHHAFEIAV